jgi:hypothetical protein
MDLYTFHRFIKMISEATLSAAKPQKLSKMPKWKYDRRTKNKSKTELIEKYEKSNEDCIRVRFIFLQWRF